MSQITPDQLQALIAYASKQLGMTPEQLQKTVQTGGLGALSDKVSPDSAAQIAALAGDREKAQQLLNSPRAQALMKQLLGGN
jgi:hypothetical protein